MSTIPPLGQLSYFLTFTKPSGSFCEAWYTVSWQSWQVPIKIKPSLACIAFLNCTFLCSHFWVLAILCFRYSIFSFGSIVKKFYGGTGGSWTTRHVDFQSTALPPELLSHKVEILQDTLGALTHIPRIISTLRGRQGTILQPSG